MLQEYENDCIFHAPCNEYILNSLSSVASNMKPGVITMMKRP
jgi:hypothetical protein